MPWILLPHGPVDRLLGYNLMGRRIDAMDPNLPIGPAERCRGSCYPKGQRIGVPCEFLLILTF
jgi:hypothetical protein